MDIQIGALEVQAELQQSKLRNKMLQFAIHLLLNAPHSIRRMYLPIYARAQRALSQRNATSASRQNYHAIWSMHIGLDVTYHTCTPTSSTIAKRSSFWAGDKLQLRRVSGFEVLISKDLTAQEL